MNLPPLPDRCRGKIPRVTPKAGEKWRAVQGRWEISADGVERRTADCAAFYDEVKMRLSKPTSGADDPF